MTANNPFPGLRPFETDEAHLFFGRETQVDELLRRLRTERFIAVVGTSGSGKSSLVRAGLFPALRVGAMSGAGSRWRIATMRPGNDPIGGLASALEHAQLLGTAGDAELRVDLAYAILERGALGLVEIVRQMPMRPDENVLIVVDQFEELFRYAQSQEDAAAAFVNLLLEATDHPALRLYFVLTMRSDFLGDCATFTKLPERINRGLYLVPRMTREQLEAAVVGPVKVAGARIAARLVNRLLNDVGDDPDQLPVLAHALMLTFDFWTAENLSSEPLDERHYGATGGLARAIDAHAERIYAALTASQRLVAEKLFRAITELGPDNRGIRRPLALSELCAACEADAIDVGAVVDAYRARTCSFLRPPPDVPLAEQTVIDISHEALMRGWSRLERLLLEEVDSARTYGRLTDAAQLYASGKAGLLTDPALTLNLQWRDRFEPTAGWAKRYGGDFRAAMDYLERSAQDQAEQRRAKRIAARRRWTIAGSAMALLLMLTFAAVASFLNAQREREQSLIAQSQFLARDANAAVEEGDAVTGMLLAQEALPLSVARPDRPFVPAAAFALENGLNNRREIHVISTGGSALWATYSRDGKRIAVQMRNDAPRIYDASSYKLLFVLGDPRDQVYFVSFSPDGKRVFTPYDDGTARIWDANTGKVVLVLRGHHGPVTGGFYSRDGKFIVTAGVDDTARIWRADTGAEVRVLRHPGALSDAEFSPDGSRIVTAGSEEGTARIWDAASGAPLMVLRAHTDVTTASYSPDGKEIATSATGGTALIWDAKRGTILHVLRGHTGKVLTAFFSPDGRSLVTASTDGTARVWDVATGVTTAIIRSSARVYGASYSPDGSRIVTASIDGTITTWYAGPLHQSLVLKGFSARVDRIGYSRDGTRIAAGFHDGTVHIWDARSGAPLLVLHASNDDVGSFDFSPDGKRIVTTDGRADRIWNATTGAPLLRLAAKGTLIVRYSLDGRQLLSLSNLGDGIDLRSFDAATGALLHEFRDHNAGFQIGAFSADGKRVVAAFYDETARIYDATDGKQIALLRDLRNTASIALSANGTRVLTGSIDDTLREWDVATGTLLLTIRTDGGDSETVSFSPDDTEMATGTGDKSDIRFFDATSGAPLAILQGHTGAVDGLSFATDGRHLESSSEDNTVRVWNVAPRLTCQALIDAARRATTRQLTAVQRQAEFLSDRAPVSIFDAFASRGSCPQP